jgi:hypothetical protein
MRKSRLSSAGFLPNWTAFPIYFFMSLFALQPWQFVARAQDASGSATAASAKELIVPASFRVDYTGALYGYYRIEADKPPELAPVLGFIGADPAMNKHLLLGMGDNFGPEFGAAVQLQHSEANRCSLQMTERSQNLITQHKDAAYPQVLYKDSNRVLGDKQVDCDNVARFLMAAGYRAIVPGREDFLYSATWLRGMALGLQWANNQRPNSPTNPGNSNKQPFPINNPDHQLTILAANLRVTGSGGKEKGSKDSDSEATDKGAKQSGASKSKPPKGASGSACPLLFAPKVNKDASHSATQTTCTSGANQVTTAMDWLSRIDATLDSATGAEETIAHETNLNNTDRDAVHQATTLQLRRTLMENQASMMLSMIDGTAGNDLPANATQLRDITTALKALANDKAYLLNENNHMLVLSPETSTSAPEGTAQRSGRNALDLLNIGLGDLPHDGATVAKPLRDLLEFGQALAGRFGLIQTNEPLLLDSLARNAGRRLLLRAIAHEQKEAGYTISRIDDSVSDTASKPGTLIIGVMGKDTMTAVSPTNLEVKPPLNFQTRGGLSPQQKSSLSGEANDSMDGNVTALDPLLTVLAVLRGAKQLEIDEQEACNGQTTCDLKESFDHVVLMAQMPRTLAEQLSTQLRVTLKGQIQHITDGSLVDAEETPILVLSEAQVDFFSPHATANYTNGTLIPVLTPDPPYDSDGSLWAPDSHVDFTFTPATNGTKLSVATTMVNDQEIHEAVTPPGCQSTQFGVLKSMENLGVERPGTCFEPQIPQCSSSNPPSAREARCERDLSAQLLGALRTAQGNLVRSDVVLLEQRDIYYGNLPEGYHGYEACGDLDLKSDDGKKCQLRVDLDRVLWKGDYAERVMISGSDLVNMLTTSQAQQLADSSLAPTDTYGQSLATFGIVQPSSPNLSQPGSGNSAFPVQQDSACGQANSSVTDPSQYCVNGQLIQSDGAYWVITSDHLANDKLIYKVMAASKPLFYHETETGETGKPAFITGAIAEALISKAHPSAPNSSFAPLAANSEWSQQLRDILHLDIGKLVAGFSARQPDGGNIYAEQFQGASDSRASTPSQQELDLESLTRVSFDLPFYAAPGGTKRQALDTSLGVQSDAEYDRAATGNLSNKPTTVTYALNSYTVGPFLQTRLPQWSGPRGTWAVASGRALPRMFLVLSPVQSQQQFTGNPLVFAFSQSPPATTPPTISQQFTVHTPRVTSLFEKAGLREEYVGGKWFKLDTGSYVEAGYEFGTQNNILSSVTLTSDGLTETCTAASSTTLSACFAAYAKSVKGFQIDDTTKLTALATAKLHTMGAYWDIHLQKNFTGKAGASAGAAGKAGAKSGINFTLDSKSDWFAERTAGKSLNTQTRYDIPLAMSLNFPVLRNLSLSPTYSAFYYSSQVTGQSIVINSFSVSAKWYFARDATVPPRRQFYFSGPASADQTSTAKIK